MVELLSHSKRVGGELMSWDMRKLIELGVKEEVLTKCSLEPKQLQDMVKGLLYLRERYPELWQEKMEGVVQGYKRKR